MTTVKRSVSLDADLDEELARRYGEGGRSRFLNEAAREKLARERMLAYLDELDAEHGPPPDALVAQVASLPRPL